MVCGIVKAPDDAWHQVADDDQVGDSDSKAFYGDCGVKNDGSIGICEL